MVRIAYSLGLPATAHAARYAARTGISRGGKMEFLLASYVYPLEEPIVLSPSLAFSLDNPRSDLEVEVVNEYLMRAYESGYNYKFPVHSEEPIVTLEDILLRFRDAICVTDQHLARIFDKYDRDNIFDFIARIWVVARFEDEGIGDTLRQEHRRMREQGGVGFFLLEDDHVLVRKPKDLANYCHLLSLLVHTESGSYFGRTFLADPEPLDPHRPTAHIWQHFMLLGFASHNYPNSQDELRWSFLPYAIPELRSVAGQLEDALRNGLAEKLLYIGGILKIASHDTQETKARILLLTSILELLLTHNPDYSRFNVEDSISKQFQLKASLLIYLNNKEKDLSKIKNRLKTIYQQRSNIAHGNFTSVEKFVQKLPKKEGKEEYFDDLVSDLYSHIRAVLEEYLKDYKLVDFIKEN